ncbi:MAG: trimeric intracellular cation channel family protein [Pseudomonadota bacterium]
MTVLQLADLLGVWVFAYSGGLVAARQRMDLFGYIVLGLLPAVGGGTLRDLILDVPVFWVAQPIYILVAISAGLFAFALPVVVGKRLTVLTWADALGMALFCIMGAAKALAVTGSPVVAVTMGVMTSTVGGMLRDVVANEIPLVLVREIYASAAVAGASVYCIAVGLAGATQTIGLLAGGAVAFLLRATGILFNLSLPIRRLVQPADDSKD